MFTTFFDWIGHPQAWFALLTLTAMEVILGIDNVLFISLIGNKLPPAQAKTARIFGLTLAFVFRVACLGGLTWLLRLTEPVVTLYGNEFSWKDFIMLGAGLFLIAQAVLELHHEVDSSAPSSQSAVAPAKAAFGAVILNIAIMDLVFSIDSILTAIGMAKDLAIMIIAIVFALIMMYVAANAVADFIHRHPTAKILALAFLVMIGMVLVAEGVGVHFPKGFVYAAMAFATAVEGLNLLAKRASRKITPTPPPSPGAG